MTTRRALVLVAGVVTEIAVADALAATTFIGALTGNASSATLAASATQLATARAINGVNFDGTAAITVADATRVLKAGDTMTGPLTFGVTTNTVTGVVGAGNPADAFTVDTNKTLNHYGLSWKGFSDATGGPSAALSGYGGVRLYTVGVERLRIDASGNVGIGGPAYGGRLSIRSGGTNTALEFDTNSIGGSMLAYDRAASAYKGMDFRGSFFAFDVNDVEKVRIDASGSLLVGTTAAYSGSRIAVCPATDATTYTSANQICVGESTRNSGYRLQLGYVAVAGTWRGSIQSFGGGSPSDLVLNGDGGNVITNVTGTAPTLVTNSHMVFNLTSNTNLRISVRGTDGTTRTANITLA